MSNIESRIRQALGILDDRDEWSVRLTRLALPRIGVPPSWHGP